MKNLIVGIVVIVVLVLLYLVYRYRSSAPATATSSNSTANLVTSVLTGVPSPDATIGIYKDPNNANNLTVIKDATDGNFYMVEVNGVRHLMVFSGSNLSIPSWGGQPTPWTPTSIGTLTKISN